MRFARAIFTLLVATAVTTSAFAQIRIIPREKRDSVANPPTLQIEDMDFAQGRNIDFGSIAEDGGAKSKRVMWSNKSKEPITITRIATSCGCVRCNYERASIQGGQSSEIVITYHPEGHPGTMRHRIFVYTDRSSQMPTAIVDIKGNVIASANRHGDYQHSIGELLLRQREVRLESMADGTQRARVACMNGGRAALTPSLDTLLSSRSLSLHCEPQVLQPNAEGDIIISYDPAANPRQEVLRLFIENGKLPPRDREIKIVTETK